MKYYEMTINQRINCKHALVNERPKSRPSLIRLMVWLSWSQRNFPARTADRLIYRRTPRS